MAERSTSARAPLTPSWSFLELLDEEDLWWEDWERQMEETYGPMTPAERLEALCKRSIEITRELYGTSGKS